MKRFILLFVAMVCTATVPSGCTPFNIRYLDGSACDAESMCDTQDAGR